MAKTARYSEFQFMWRRLPFGWQAAAAPLILPPNGMRSLVGALESCDKWHCAIDRASAFEVGPERLSNRSKRAGGASPIKQIETFGSFCHGGESD
jgi:hypothetical protein